MVKNLISYIFIYVLLTGCEQNIVGSEYDLECEADCHININAPSLQKDENGYYHMEWLEGYSQTFTTLDANTGINGHYRVYWDSPYGITYGGEFVSCVNPASYTGDDGTAHTVMAVWESMINDTITVYSGYIDWCNNQHIDSLKVIVDNFN